MRGPRGIHILAWGILLFTVTCLAWISWETWGDPIIDLSREVYVPWQIRGGHVLYRTLTYNYGPVAPYLFAGLTKIFGDTLTLYEIVGAAIGLSTVAALYRLGCRLASIGVGLAAALLFVLHSFFGATTWGTNYVLPYSYAATISMSLAVWSLVALIGYVEDWRLSQFYVGVGLTLAAALTKQEVGLAIVITWIAAAWRCRFGRREIAAAVLLSAVVTGACLWYFSGRQGEHSLFADNLLKFADGSGSSFFRDVAGVGRWRFNPTDQSAYVLALPVAVAILIFMTHRSVWLLALFTVLCAPRIFLAYTPTWYGFYLFVPGYLVMSYAAWAWLRQWRFATIAAVLLAGVIATRTVVAESAACAAKTEVLVTGKGAMRDDPIGRVAAIEELLDYLKRHAKADETMVVLPEGALLNWMSGLRNPTAYYSFIPPEVDSEVTERRMIAEVEAGKPTFVAVNSRSLMEFGRKDFAYMRALMGDIERHYGLVAQFGDPSGRLFRLALLKRTNDD